MRAIQELHFCNRCDAPHRYNTQADYPGLCRECAAPLIDEARKKSLVHDYAMRHWRELLPQAEKEQQELDAKERSRQAHYLGMVQAQMLSNVQSQARGGFWDWLTGGPR